MWKSLSAECKAVTLQCHELTHPDFMSFAMAMKFTTYENI